MLDWYQYKDSAALIIMSAIGISSTTKCISLTICYDYGGKIGCKVVRLSTER